MELDERLRWIETRVTSSLKPRAEELKHLFTNDDCRFVASMVVLNLYALKIIIACDRKDLN